MKKQAHPLGELIHQEKDAEGLISIYQRRHQRFLTFGNAVEQSCFHCDCPYRLEHVYTQGMMLALLLLEQCGSALLLGLGGGSLARALRRARPELMIDAVEFRQSVINIARQYFELQEDQHLQLHCDEATDYLEHNSSQYDLIFADLYLAEGVHADQYSKDFIVSCREHLSRHGILLMNSWSSEFRDNVIAQRSLQSVFGDRVIYFHVQGGNVIAFAFNGNLPDLQRTDFYTAASQLGELLEIPLQKLARNFWRQNSQALRLARYACNN